MNVMNRLWTEEAGFIISTELMIVATVLVLGMLVGLVTLRDQVVQELADVAEAISNFNQSYTFSGILGHSSSTAGSQMADVVDFCDQPSTVVNVGLPVDCVQVTIAPSGTE